jgi:hypothetical protein
MLFYKKVRVHTGDVYAFVDIKSLYQFRAARFQVLTAASIKIAVFWDASIALVMAASTSETLVNFYKTTRRNIPEDSHLHTNRKMAVTSEVLYTRNKFDFRPMQLLSVTNVTRFEVPISVLIALASSRPTHR